jgi:predicted O-linked N-acetylglucosamine transferase (SPINDLY family)
MCVPLLTKKGDRFISRCGESINYNLGMEDWIAENEDDYVNKAVLFSKDIKKLEIIKKKLIQYSRSTNLFNMNKFAKEFIERMTKICSSV